MKTKSEKGGKRKIRKKKRNKKKKERKKEEEITNYLERWKYVFTWKNVARGRSSWLPLVTALHTRCMIHVTTRVICMNVRIHTVCYIRLTIVYILKWSHRHRHRQMSPRYRYQPIISCSSSLFLQEENACSYVSTFEFIRCNIYDWKIVYNMILLHRHRYRNVFTVSVSSCNLTISKFIIARRKCLSYLSMIRIHTL